MPSIVKPGSVDNSTFDPSKDTGRPQDSTSNAAPKDDRIFYVVVSAFAALLAIVLVVALPYIRVSVPQAQPIQYAALLLLGISVAAFLFGAMRSYAAFTHRTVSTKLELGGPAAVAFLVVIGGLYTVRDPGLEMTVRVVNESNSTPLQGTVRIVSVADPFTAKQSLDKNSEQTVFSGIPSYLMSTEFTFFYDEKGYELTGSDHAILSKLITLHVRTTDNASLRQIRIATLTSGDLAYTRTILEGLKQQLDRQLHIVGGKYDMYSLMGPSTAWEASQKEWKNRVQTIAHRGDYDYLVGVGTQASMALKRYAPHNPLNHNTKLLFLGVTDPVSAKLVDHLKDRNDPTNSGGVAYLSAPEDWAAMIINLLPDYRLSYIYQAGFPQDESIALRLQQMPSFAAHRFALQKFDHLPTLNDLRDPNTVYFSWYTFEKMFEDGKEMEVLKQRLVVASTRQNVETPGLAGIGVSVDDREIGQEGADLLMDDFAEKVPLGKSDIRVPILRYWVNCVSAQRLGLRLSKAVRDGAQERYECAKN